MAISNTVKNKLNKSNAAAKAASLGTFVQNIGTYIGKSGSANPTSGDVSASNVTIATGLTGLVGELVQVRSSAGSVITLTSVVNSGSNLTVTCGSAVAATPRSVRTGDIVTWVVW